MQVQAWYKSDEEESSEGEERDGGKEG